MKPAPNAPTQPGRAVFSLRGLLIVLAVLAILADGFVIAVLPTQKAVRRSNDYGNGRYILQAWVAEYADEKTGLPPEVLRDVRAFAAHLARTHGLMGAGLWLSPLDPAARVSGLDLRGSILTDDKSRLALGFESAPFAWAVALVPNITELPPETPVFWTRGLQADGTWRADSPYGTKRGTVVTASGDTRLIQGKITGLEKWGTKVPTDNIAEALPPGTRISEYTLTPQMVERIRQRELMLHLGVAGGLLVVGLGCAGTAFGRRHWLPLGIIGGSVVFQWWLAAR